MLRVAQTISQIGLHMGVAFGLMYAFTGSIAFGGVAALIEPLCNVVLLPLHDRLWRRLRAAPVSPSRVDSVYPPPQTVCPV
jgi:uncharacterized membrane protein